MIQVSLKDDKLWIVTGIHPLDVAKVSGMPGRRYNKKAKAWSVPVSRASFDYLKSVWESDQVWTLDVSEAWTKVQAAHNERQSVVERKESGSGIDTSLLDGIPFKTPPMSHQKIALSLGVPQAAFAYLMDMGTGKTWTTINDMAIQWSNDEVDIVIVAAPNSVCSQWLEQIEEHLPRDVPVEVGQWVSSPRKADRDRQEHFSDAIHTQGPLFFYIVNIEAIGVDRCLQYLLNLTKYGKTAIVIDESTKIKNRTSKRFKAAMKIRKKCVMARILSGTLVAKSPMDAFAQFNFLDPDILGFENFYSFRNHFGIMGGYKNKQVVTYKNLEELARLIQTASYRVTKEECLDLPSKVYLTRDVKMDPTQKREYERMRKEMIALMAEQCGVCGGCGFTWNEEQETSVACYNCYGDTSSVAVTIALTQMLRLQQITSGFITDGDDVLHWFTEKPPKIMETMDILEDAGDQSCIMWSNHRPEIDRLCQELAYRKRPYVEIHGGISPPQRIINRNLFQEGGYDLVGHAAAGGIGLNLFRASIAIYLSSGFKTEDRVQSEARNHRKGSEIHDKITFWDLICPGTIDRKILRVIKQDRNLSDEIMRGGLLNLLGDEQ